MVIRKRKTVTEKKKHEQFRSECCFFFFPVPLVLAVPLFPTMACQQSKPAQTERHQRSNCLFFNRNQRRFFHCLSGLRWEKKKTEARGARRHVICPPGVVGGRWSVVGCQHDHKYTGRAVQTHNWTKQSVKKRRASNGRAKQTNKRMALFGWFIIRRAGSQSCPAGAGGSEQDAHAAGL